MLLRVETYADNSGNVSKTFHPCLATADEDDAGCLFKAGRKMGDALFSNDKSVSRQHLLIRCVGNLPSMMEPRTDEERKACSDSEYEMCLVLENSGKAPTYVAKVNDEPAITEIADDSETDEETDDEGISQQSNRGSNVPTSSGLSPPNVSTATRKYFGNKPIKFDEVNQNQSQIFPISYEPIILQLGRGEATIKITSIPLRILCSSLKTKVLPQLHQIGALKVEEDGSPTHLVAEELNAGAKQIIAWAQQIPMVRVEFLEALMDRKTPFDPLPNLKDYPVLVHSDKTGKIDFWTTTPNPRLLSKFTLLSLESGSFEILAKAAGVNILSLEKIRTEKSQLKFAREAVEKNDSIYITSNSRKRISKKLSEELGLSRVDLKRLAKAVVSQNSYLQSTTGSTIGESSNDEKENESQPAPKMRKEQDESTQDSHSLSAQDTQQETQCLLDVPSQSISKTIRETKARGNLQKEDKMEAIPEENSRQDESFGQAMEEDEEDTTPSSRRKQRKLSITTTRKLEAADKHGWFNIAPKDDSVRKALRKESARAHSETESNIDFLEPAETECLVLTVTDSSQSQQSNRSSGRRRRKQNVPDFRAFRKNSVMPVHQSAIIELRIVGAREAEDQEEFDEHERELAEEQRRADALFRGEGGGGARKRRKRTD